MESSLCHPSLQPLTEHIMSVMCELKEKNFTDNTLLSNLDFAEKFLRDHPLKLDSKLLVKGSHSCAQFGKNNQRVFTVTTENNKTHVSLLVHSLYSDTVTEIDPDHFFNHSCQDEVKSCFTRAQEAVAKGEGLVKLHIKCNRFSVNYTSKYRGKSTIVETKCQLKLERISAEGLLNKKAWLQKEMPTCQGLIACLNHLIIQYLKTTAALPFDYRFVFHGDNETIIITSGEKDEKVYVLLHDHEGVSMFPPTL